MIYSIRSFYRTKKNEGIMLILSAKLPNGTFSSLRAYVPFSAKYEDSSTAEIVLPIGGKAGHACVNIYAEKQFEEKPQNNSDFSDEYPF